ncbi:DUF72 domain-containing protein [Granulosicoccaceae sp. 1_MG-2023]|nr:DUF72 domain-containing protein [Granulosicoccaceae sp. 1_MG-2023]
MHYYIGLPEWRHPQWYATRPANPLNLYAQHFSTIEGNSSFYALPSADNLAAWRDSVPAHFRFCFKFPRTISHDAQLRHCGAELREFLNRLVPLQDRTGLLWLQMGPQFSARNLPDLAAFVAQLPADFHYGIEVRHRDFFRKDENSAAFHRLLAAQGINRVMFDTRTLFAHPAEDEATRDALRKKPRFPLQVVATGAYPMVRFISPMQINLAEQALDQWAAKICQWISEQRTPYVFFHTPDIREAPQLAQRFADKVAALNPELQALTLWDAPPEQDTLPL